MTTDNLITKEGGKGGEGKLKKKPCIKLKGVEQPVGGGGGEEGRLNFIMSWGVNQVHFSLQAVRFNKASISTFNTQN